MPGTAAAGRKIFEMGRVPKRHVSYMHTRGGRLISMYGRSAKNASMRPQVARYRRRLYLGKQAANRLNVRMGLFTRGKKRKIYSRVKKSGHNYKTGFNKIRRLPRKLRTMIATTGGVMRYQNARAASQSLGTGLQNLQMTTWFGGNELFTLSQEYSNNKTQEVWVKEVRGKDTFINPTNSIIDVACYHIEPKHDISGVAYTNPLNAWDQGMIDEGYVALGSVPNPSNLYRSTPFKSYAFTSNYTVKKVSTCQLGPGEEFVNHVNLRPWKKINIPHLAQLNQTDSVSSSECAYRGFTCWSMYTFNGVPCKNTADTEVTTTPAHYLHVREYTTHVYAINPNTTSYDAAHSLNSLPVATTAKLMDTMTGLVEAFVDE